MDKERKRIISIALVVVSVFLIGRLIVATTSSSDKTTKTNTQTPTKTAPENETKTETTIETIPYKTNYVDDPNLEYGKTEIRTKGSGGEITHTYEVTYKNGIEVSRKQIKEETTKQPTNEVVAKGTAIIWRCVDATSYNKNPYDDNKCTSSTGEARYVSDSQARALDPSYSPGQSGHPYYNSR